MPPPKMPVPPDDEYEGDESFRVNVPMDSAPSLADGPDEGYALVKFTKDDKGYCLDLESLMLPDEQPTMPEVGEDDTLEEAVGKLINEPADDGEEEVDES